ncbi:hypothetical protein PFUM301597_29510 [Pseudomonas fluorescens]
MRNSRVAARSSRNSVFSVPQPPNVRLASANATVIFKLMDGALPVVRHASIDKTDTPDSARPPAREKNPKW